MINQILTALHCDNVPKVPHEHESKGMGAEAGAEDWEMDALEVERGSRFGVCRADGCGVLIPYNFTILSQNICDDCVIPF